MRWRKPKTVVKFQPFRNPTSKVREAWSKFATTLSTGAFTGAAVVTWNEIYSIATALRVVALVAAGVLLQLAAVYVLKDRKESL